MQRLPFGFFVSATVSLWAVIVLLHCVCTNYGSLLTIRCLLGAVESGIFIFLQLLHKQVFAGKKSLQTLSAFLEGLL